MENRSMFRSYLAAEMTCYIFVTNDSTPYTTTINKFTDFHFLSFSYRKIPFITAKKTTWSSYQAIKRNPTMKIERKVTEVLRSLEKKGKLPSDLRKKVQNQNSSTPQLYGLPKIHKASVPLRPIVSSINSPTYNLSRYLAGVLPPLWGKLLTFCGILMTLSRRSGNGCEHRR